MKATAATKPRLDEGFGNRTGRVPKEVVIVAPNCDRFDDFVTAGRRGEIGLHFCVDARSAIRMARRFRADVWLVAAELPDMAGLDLLEILMPFVSQAAVDPMLGGATISLNRLGRGVRSSVFLVADAHAVETEQRALRTGAGYLAGPVSIDLLLASRSRSAHAVTLPP